MNWLVLAVGLLLAFVASAGAAALVTTARGALGEAISRRLRGSTESLGWIADTERQVAAASAATSLGFVVVGAAIPGVFVGLTLWQFGLVIGLLVVPATLFGGYLLPRWLTEPRAARTVERLDPWLRGWSALLGVVLPSRQHDPADDVMALAREGAASGMGGRELVMVGGVMTFAERPVREIMTPRTAVIAVAHDANHVEVLSAFAESGYTRIPVYRGTLDEIVGMVHAFDLFKHRPGDAMPVRAVSYAPASRLAGDLLLDMQRERRHFAVVLDEFGGTAGIVTLEDLLEGLVGEISDEDDAAERPAAEAASPLLEVDGSATVSEVAEHFGVTLPPRSAASFGGLVAELLGRIPAAGERFRLADLELEVLQAAPTRIERLLVRRAGAPVTDLNRVLG